MGGVEIVFYTITPILLVLIWAKLFGINDVGAYVMYVTALVASTFRGIKIGWLKK